MHAGYIHRDLVADKAVAHVVENLRGIRLWAGQQRHHGRCADLAMLVDDTARFRHASLGNAVRSMTCSASRSQTTNLQVIRRLGLNRGLSQKKQAAHRPAPLGSIS